MKKKTGYTKELLKAFIDGIIDANPDRKVILEAIKDRVDMLECC